ncbi:MAG: hypothetical protein ACT4R6_11260 [Gemmatimonadaceae bacterium]
MLAEVITISAGGDEVPGALSQAHPEVRFCFAPQGASEGQLRSLGMREATGDIVALRRVGEVDDLKWLDVHFLAATGIDPATFDAAERAAYDGRLDGVDDARVELTAEPSATSAA